MNEDILCSQKKICASERSIQSWNYILPKLGRENNSATNAEEKPTNRHYFV